eukprot:3458584-Alexandrium_andersonii.AAC.1
MARTTRCRRNRLPPTLGKHHGPRPLLPQGGSTRASDDILVLEPSLLAGYGNPVRGPRREVRRRCA